MKILFFGDIIGKIGRKAVKAVLSDYKKEFEPDLVVANAENIAHGIGFTKNTLNELREAGIDFFTSGNHVFKKPESTEVLNEKDSPIIRPANYPENNPGEGFKTIEVGSKSLLVINLLGQVFMKEEVENPFKKLDEIIQSVKPKNLAGIIVDFHAEATSEKEALGWYADGKVSAVLGTHTHVQTSDETILPEGTAFICDVGMVGAADSIIGDTKEPIIESFLEGKNPVIGIPESGEVKINFVLLEIDPETKKTTKITRLDRKIKV